ncbi:MAG: hypothetical protein LBQ10_09820 [Desulfovibrio sp.]|nr:hypothetical protein [Desulfovibrio sp.]
MMERFISFLNDVLSVFLLPATLYGAGGALMHAGRKGKSFRQVLFEVLGGVLTTNALAPLIRNYCPDEAQTTLYFLVGWGGLKCVDRIYEAVVAALERRIQRKLGDE